MLTSIRTKLTALPQKFAKSPKRKESRRHRVAILTNVIAPYRIPIFSQIAEHFDTRIFISGEETDRGYWKGEESRLRNVTVKRSAGVTIKYKVGKNQVYNTKFLHFPYGHILDLLRARPDAVVTVEMGFRTVVALLYGTVFRKPVWIWWGGTLHTERRLGVSKRILRRVISRWAKRWISYGSTSSEYLMSLAVPPNRILQIQNCVDESIYTKPVRAALSVNPRPVFLYVGRMIGLKGIDRLLQVASVLQKEGHTFSLLLIGEGPEKNTYEQMSRELCLRNVTFVPAQAPPSMPAYYRSADYLVFPTFDDVWGLVVNEALWAGLPVLCSVYAGCANELLPEDQLFDPANLDDFASAMRRALNGELPPPDTRRLKTCEEVARKIIDHIRTEFKLIPGELPIATERSGRDENSAETHYDIGGKSRHTT